MTGEPAAGRRPPSAAPLELTLTAPPADCLAAVEEAAEMWGAAWAADRDGGRLELPVVAGVRRGVLSATIAARSEPGGTALSLTVHDARYRINLAATVVLGFGLAGAGVAILWPFFPVLLPAAPVAVVLALAAWFLVASRVRTSTAVDFLELVARLSEQRTEPPAPRSPA